MKKNNRWVGEFAPNGGHDPKNPYPLKSVYASGSKRRGTTLKKNITELLKYMRKTPISKWTF